MINKLEAARRQIECAIRLVAAVEDQLAIHTLTMAAFGILRGLSKGRHYYEVGIKPELNVMGKKQLNAAANFLKHADRDPTAILEPFAHEGNDWRIGFCVILYRDLAGGITPEMAAFHTWMVIRHPDQFMLAEDEDKDFEQAYREAIQFLRQSGRDAEIAGLQVYLEMTRSGVLRTNIGFQRKPYLYDSGND
jgi:hypothetical protein